MGYKKVCFSCRKAFSIYRNDSTEINLVCPECGNPSVLFNHKFRPPAQKDLKNWKMAEFLKDNGFNFNHAYEYIDAGAHLQVPYPKTMEEARDFVLKHRKRQFNTL